MEFTLHSLHDVLPQLEDLERAVLSVNKVLDHEERELLKQTDGMAVLCKVKNTVVGGAYAVPSKEVEDFLKKFDDKFVGHNKAIYIHSVSVLSKYHHQGVRHFLSRQLIHCARLAGHTVGFAHVRHDGVADKAARIVYRPHQSRLCRNFFGKSEDSLLMRFQI